MRRSIATVLGVVCLAAASAHAADAPPEARARVEALVERTTVYVGESVRVRLRIAFERTFADRSLVAMFRRPLDVPVQVRAPWMRGLADAGGAPETAPLRSFALDDDVALAVASAETAPDGVAVAVFETARRLVPERAGTLELAAPELRFSFATRFADDALRGRVPMDPQETVVRGAPLALRVLDLPADGRPAGFGGAIGRFAVAADVAPRTVDAGASVRLTLRISGEGNLTTLEPPRLDALAGFHLFGTLDDRGAPVRTVTYDLSPSGADVRAVPPVEFAFFDPEPPGTYRTLRTEPIPLVVRGGREPPAPAPQPPAPDDARASGGTSRWVYVTGPLVLFALFLILRRQAKHGSAAQEDPTLARSRAAATAARAALARDDADPAGVLAAYLAAHLGCTPAAVVSPDLAARLTDAGFAPERAARAAATLERLVASRYGGAPPADARATVLALVD